MHPSGERRPRRLHLGLAFVAFLGLLASRRWQQLIEPQIWNEDGTQILPGLLVRGWAEVFAPTNGYLITSSKLISGLSLSISLSHYPLVGTLLNWVFIALVGVAIAISPTRLRGKTACALAVFMVPSDPEVFGPPLYSFWWASLLLFLVALWDEKADADNWRLVFLLLGGLSSPVIAMILPVLYLRAFLFRRSRPERTVAVVATLIAAVQIVLIVQAGAGTSPPLLSVAMTAVPRLVGTFLVGNWLDGELLLWASGLLLLGIAGTWWLLERTTISPLILLYLLGGSIALAAARNDPAILHPVIAGPRYFFFPYICLSWILIQVFCRTGSPAVRSGVAALGLLALFNAYPAWSRGHESLNWAAHVRSCRLFPEYAMAVQYDGRRASAWTVRIPGERCSAHLARDLLIFDDEWKRLPTFPYSVIEPGAGPDADRPQLVSGTVNGSDYYRSRLKGHRVVGSYQASDADTGELVLKLRRGDRLAYRSGPRGANQRLSINGHEAAFLSELPTALDWISLDFSNADLPSEFLVTIRDEGTGWGEWFAVGVAE